MPVAAAALSELANMLKEVNNWRYSKSQITQVFFKNCLVLDTHPQWLINSNCECFLYTDISKEKLNNLESQAFFLISLKLKPFPLQDIWPLHILIQNNDKLNLFCIIKC